MHDSTIVWICQVFGRVRLVTLDISHVGEEDVVCKSCGYVVELEDMVETMTDAHHRGE